MLKSIKICLGLFVGAAILSGCQTATQEVCKTRNKTKTCTQKIIQPVYVQGPYGSWQDWQENQDNWPNGWGGWGNGGGWGGPGASVGVGPSPSVSIMPTPAVGIQ